MFYLLFSAHLTYLWHILSFAAEFPSPLFLLSSHIEPTCNICRWQCFQFSSLASYQLSSRTTRASVSIPIPCLTTPCSLPVACQGPPSGFLGWFHAVWAVHPAGPSVSSECSQSVVRVLTFGPEGAPSVSSECSQSVVSVLTFGPLSAPGRSSGCFQTVLVLLLVGPNGAPSQSSGIIQPVLRGSLTDFMVGAPWRPTGSALRTDWVHHKDQLGAS